MTSGGKFSTTPFVRAIRLYALVVSSLILIPAQAIADNSAFGCSRLLEHREGVFFEGDDGFFFREPDVRMLLPFPQRSVDLIAELSEALAEHGTTLIFAPVPTKSQILHEFVPEEMYRRGFNTSRSIQLYKLVVEELRERGVVTVDLIDALSGFDPESPPFHRTDFHWNSAATRLAAQAIADVVVELPNYETFDQIQYETSLVSRYPANPPLRRRLQAYCRDALPVVMLDEWETTILSNSARSWEEIPYDPTGATRLEIDLGAGEATGQATPALDLGLGNEPQGASGAVDLGLGTAPEAASGALDLGLGTDPAANSGLVDLGLGGNSVAGEDVEEIFRVRSMGPPIALAGTSYSAATQGNFSGWIAQYTSVEVLNVSVTGGGRFGSMTSYLTSRSFLEEPPHILIWEAAIYSKLPHFGEEPLLELIAAARRDCFLRLDTTAGEGNLLTADLSGHELTPDMMILADAGRANFASGSFVFQNALGESRSITPHRETRGPPTGRFMVSLEGLRGFEIETVSIDFSRSPPSSAQLYLCRR